MAREASMARPKINFKDENVVTYGENEDALVTFTAGEKVLNFGNLTTNGDLANGIFAQANDVWISNFGDIETFGREAAGILALGDDARLENYGSIVTHGDPIVFTSDGMFAIGDRFYMVNHGSIRVDGFAASAMDALGDDGVIINYGDVDVFSDGSWSLATFGNRSNLVNFGHITASGFNDAGMVVAGEVPVAAGEGSAALNRGEVEITGEHCVGIGTTFDRDCTLTNAGTVDITGDHDFGMLARGDEHDIINSGLIETHGTYAIGISATGGRLGFFPNGFDENIVNTGHIITEGNHAIGVALGLYFTGFGTATDGQIINSGVIETVGDGAAGVLMNGNGHHLTNSGLISTDGGAFDGDPIGLLRAAGVVISGDDALIENTQAGVIRSADADSAAIELNVIIGGVEHGEPIVPIVDRSSEVENYGRIEGAAIAILGGDGQETVINHGTIVGDVVLGDGADTFVFGKGGTLAGNLFLGGGNDFVRIENGSGTSQIADFGAGDVIDVSTFFSSFGDLEAHSQQSGNDVVITLDHNDHLVPRGCAAQRPECR
jgi:hypothetical protein